jgi:hypothetical protein
MIRTRPALAGPDAGPGTGWPGRRARAAANAAPPTALTSASKISESCWAIVVASAKRNSMTLSSSL